MDARRLAPAASGPVAVGVASLAIGIALAMAPSFSITGSALSDLGTADHPAPAVFNAGLVIAGLAGLPFAARLVLTRDHSLGAIGGGLFGASLVALAGVGAFPSSEPLHAPAAVLFYLLATYGIAAADTGRVLAGAPGGLFGCWIALAHLTVWLLWGLAVALDLVAGGPALPELVGGALLAGWIVVRAR